MKKLKNWLIEHFLPVYLKGELLKEIERLRKENQEKQIHIQELNAYIEGLEFALRSQRRITVNNHTGKPHEEVKP